MKIRALQIILLASLIALPVEAKVTKVVKWAEELIALAKAGKKVKPANLLRALDRVPVARRAEFEKYADEIPDFVNCVCRRSEYIDFVLKNPKLAKGATKCLNAYPGRQTLRMLDDILSSPNGDRLVNDLIAKRLDAGEMRQLANALGGKTYSSTSLQAIIDKSKDVLPPADRGNLFELVGSKILQSGRRVENLPLKKGTKLVDGKFDGVKGIDKIGISPEGKPVLIEMSINKDLGKLTEDGVQMSPRWCAGRWNKFLAKNPDKVDELIAMGLDPKYKTTFKSSDFLDESLFLRKICLPKDGKVQGLIYTGTNGRGRLKPSDIAHL